jgi:hypothetical protein
MSTSLRKFYLYKNYTLSNQSNDLDYSLFWLLNNYSCDNTIDLRIDIVNIDLDDFPFETIKIINNKLVKINNLVGNTITTIYSPYDLDYFNKLELSLLYQKIYNQSPSVLSQPILSQPVLSQPVLSQPILSQPVLSQPILSQPVLSQPVLSQPVLSQPNELDNISKDDITELLIIFKNDKKNIEENLNKKETEWIDKDCDIKFEKMQLRKREERLKEKYDIFKNDISIYNILIKKENFSEDFIPHLFVGKYYILKYLYTNNYFSDEDITKPSPELFTLYRFLYVSLNNTDNIDDDDLDELEKKIKNNKFHEDNDFNNLSDNDNTYSVILDDFINFLPNNKEIITDKQIMSNINKKSDNDMFNEDTGFELNSDSETSESDNTSFDSSYVEKNLQKNMLKDIETYCDYEKNKKNISDDFINKYIVIKYLFKEGHLNMMDVYEYVDDCIYLYDLLNDYINKKNIPNEILDAFSEEINNFSDYMKLSHYPDGINK